MANVDGGVARLDRVAATKRHRVQGRHVVDVGVLPRLVHFSDDVKRTIVGDFDADPRSVQVSISESGCDTRFQVTGRISGGLQLSDQGQANISAVVDLKLTSE